MFPSSPALRGLGLLAAISFLTTVVVADTPRSKADADQLLRKLALVEVNGLATKPAARRTLVTEREINSFLSYHAKTEIPDGVMDPALSIDDAGRLTARAMVDLDAVRRAQGDAAPTLAALLHGRVPVEAAGVLDTRNGVGRFELQSATVGGVPVPKGLLQQVVSYYSRTPDLPDGIDLDAPFPLPARIREIQTSRGEAVIVQ